MEKLTPTEWQLDDLAHLDTLDASANWSQMGCYKTSTALWLTERKTYALPNPAVLIVTTMSGKGAYYRDVPRCLSGDWQILNVKMDGVYILINGTEIKIGKTLPEEIQFPHIVVTHYHLFSKSTHNSKVPCKMCEGTGKYQDLEICPGCLGKKKVAAPKRPCDYLLERTWDMAILDEAHKIKNPDTKWTVNLKRLKAQHKHVMTGSGFVNRPDEIWSLLNFLNKVEYSSYWDFRGYFCMEDDWNGYRQVVGLWKSRVPEFRKIRADFGPRRTKPEVFPELTEPIYEDIEVELNSTQRAMYDQIKRELATLDQKGEPLHSPNVLSQLQRMRQIAVATPDVISDEYDPKHERRVVKIKLVEPSSKLDAFMEVLEGLQWDDEDKQQIVVFSNFNDPLNLLQERLMKKGINFIRLKQEDNDRERFHKWNELFPQKTHQVFLSTIKLGGESIDLTPAQYVSFLDMDWAPANNNQAIERVWRPGFDTSKGAPVVIRFFARDTVDKRILDLNETKAKWFNQIFGKDEEE